MANLRKSSSVKPSPVESIDVLIVARDDWANVGYSFERALRSVGVNAKSIKQNPHSFDYGEQSEVMDKEATLPYYDAAKAVLFMHSRADFKPAKYDVSKKWCAVFHGGSPYRRNPSGVNAVFNPMVQATLIQTGDLLGLGAKNEHWVIPPVDTDAIQPVYGLHPRLVFGHCPRHPDMKGSDAIVGAVSMVRDFLESDSPDDAFDFVYDTANVSHADALLRMADVDIYIESLAQTDSHGHPIGEWGVTALEAAALGKIVVTIFRSAERYEQEFGKCPIIPANDPEMLKHAIVDLVKGHRTKLKGIQRRTRAWVEQYHSFEAVGRKLRDIFAPALEG